ncbi:MAG: Kazal domain-containing protein [Candidatus Electrothrix sp. MAN1_4]|nr:Kazal domain-containing protein [Candidatus Electrothrix sp. MAN1_4]
MKFLTWLMMCSALLLLNGCYYPNPHPQPPSPQPPSGVCGGIAGWGCPLGQFCNFEQGKCSMPDAQGTCRPRPDMCTQQYNPVCGCNGKTYGNACMAAQAGVSVKYSGRCERDRRRPARGNRRYR